MVIFKFRGYFGHFMDFSGILVILEISEVFWSFKWFLSIFGDFRDIKGILVILEVSWVFCKF